MTVRVFYNSFGTPELYDMIRDSMPPDTELVTLTSDAEIERLEKIADCHVAIVAASRLTAAIIAAAPQLRLVHHQGVGYQDTIDVAALAERGIRLALTPEGTTVGVAEHTVLLILAATRRLPFADSELRQGRWHVNSLRTVSTEIAGKSVGYVGFGRIGRETARRLRSFGTIGRYHDPQVVLTPEEQSEFGVTPCDFDTLIATSDIVSLHIPLTAASRHIIDRRTIGAMKPGVIVINTARGGLIDEHALADALTSGQVGAAGLDVFEAEPLAAGHPLALLENVVLSPHISAGTRDAMRQKMNALFANVDRFFKGEPLRNEVVLSADAAE